MTLETKYYLACYNSDGSLDTSFGRGGKVTTDVMPSHEDWVSSMAIDSRGRIVVGGWSRTGPSMTSESVFTLARYNMDGSLDTSFAGTGKVATDFRSMLNEQIRALVIDEFDRVVVGGRATRSTAVSRTPAWQFALARRTEDGGPDTTFHRDGKVLTDFSSATSESLEALAIDTHGRIVAAGWAKVRDANRQFALARYTDRGFLDGSFDGDGKVLTDFRSVGGEDAQAFALAIDTHGKIVTGGCATVGGNTRFALARYNDNGSLDASFQDEGRHEGIVLTDFRSATGEGVTALAIDDEARIVVGGWASVDSGGWGSRPRRQFALARYLHDGALDRSFHGDGKVLTDFYSSPDEAISALVIDDGGRIVVAGAALGPRGNQFALARYDDDGSLDSSFDHDGKVLTDFATGVLERGKAIAIGGRGKIIVAGSA